MKKIVLLILILFSFNVYADTCDNNELKRLKDLAEKVEFSYDYEIKNEVLEDGSNFPVFNFSITANNLNEDLKVLILYDKYSFNNKEFKYNNQKTSSIDGFFEGDIVNITIEGYTSNACSGKTILTKTVKIPYYNRNYDENFCYENPDFKYCMEFTEKSISSSEYSDALLSYIDNTSEIEDNKNETSHNYTIYIIGSVFGIIILLLLISYILKRKRKNSL